MNWLDMMILVFLCFSVIMGLRKGLIKSLVPLVCLLIAIPLAGVASGPVAEKLGDHSWSHVLAFIIIWAVVYIAVAVGAWFLQKILDVMLMGWIDKLGGVAFGLAAGWILCSMIVLIVARYAVLPVDLPDIIPDDIERWLEDEGRSAYVYSTIDDSAIASAQLDSSSVILGLLPSRFDDVKDFFD